MFPFQCCRLGLIAHPQWLSASLPNVGRNRNARLITNAISCACMPNFAKGLSNASNASVMAVGVVVARNTAPTIMTTTNLQAYSMAIRTPSSVIGIGPMFVRTLPGSDEEYIEQSAEHEQCEEHVNRFEQLFHADA